MEPKMRSEYFGQQFKKRQLIIAILLVMAILATAAMPTTAQASDETYRSYVYKLKQIPAETARQHLRKIGLGIDFNKFENTNALVVTVADADDKARIANFLNLVDTNIAFEVTKLTANASTISSHKTETINAAVRGIEIGSLTAPPITDGPAKAIVDVNGQDLFVVAPKGLLNPIIAGLARLPEPEITRPKTVIVKPVISAAQKDTVLMLSETGSKKEAASKKEKTPAPKANKSSAGVDLSTLSPTMRQLLEARKQLNDALKKANADSVNEFMKDENNAKQINSLTKGKQLDSDFLDRINKAKKQEELKAIEAAKAKAAAEAKAKAQAQAIADIEAKAAARKAAAEARAKQIEEARLKVAAEKAKAAATQKQGPTIEEMNAYIEKLNALKASTEKAVSQRPKREPLVLPDTPTKSEVYIPRQPKQKTRGHKKITSKPKFPAGMSKRELETIIKLPTNVEIARLLELLGMNLGLNYMYDPEEIKGEVKLFIHDGKITVRELYSLVESVMKFKGFVMTRRDKLVTIVSQGKAPELDTDFFGVDENIGDVGGNVIVTKLFKVEHIDTATAQKVLTDMKLGISIQSMPNFGKMIITGYAYRMDKIQQMLDVIDIKGEQKIFKYRMLQYLTPSELAPKLEILAKELESISLTVSDKATAAAPTSSSPSSSSSRGRKLSPSELRAKAAADARRRALGSRSNSSSSNSSAIGEESSKDVYLDIDDRTNRILMIGLADKIDIVDDLIDILDVRQQSITVIRQYKIEYVDASIVMDILDELGVTSGSARPVTSGRNAMTSTRPSSGRSSNSSSRTSSRSTRSTTQPTTRGATSEGPKISLLTETNSLLVNATYEKHQEIMAIIDHVDRLNPDERKIKEYEIKNVDTQEILDTLMELGITSANSTKSSNSRQGYSNSRQGYSNQRQNSSRMSSGRSGTSKSSAQTPSISTNFSEPLADEPQIAVLETTNSLLVNATAKQHASIEMVIRHVDRDPDETATPYVIYPLENQDPDELKPILDELVNATIQGKTGGSGTNSGKSATTNKIMSQTKTTGIRDKDERVTIVSDPATYSLVVYASKKNQMWIGSLISELDAYRPQVLLDVTLVEVSKNDDFSYDLNVLSSIPDLAMGNTSGLANNIIGGENPVSASSIFDKLMNSGQNSFRDMQSHGGNFTGFYGNNKVMALMHAMQKKNYGRILAKPKLLVDDNQEGTIETKNTVYIERKTTNVIAGNDSDPYTSESQSFDPYDAKISLTIKPHISKGENLRLEITLSRSDFVGLDPTSTKPPDQALSDVQTVATVPNNHTIILGGMDRINQSKGGTKIPILGDIPFIGGLFRSTGNTSQQRKLYVFVKAHILRPGQELNSNSDIINISRKYRRDFEEKENEMQEYEDWPGIKPQPMDPPQILDNDEAVSTIQVVEPHNATSSPVINMPQPQRKRMSPIIDMSTPRRKKKSPVIDMSVPRPNSKLPIVKPDRTRAYVEIDLNQ